MKRFIEGEDRRQATLLPDSLDDYREDLGDDGLPPLNTEAGQAWLKREIAAIKPDLCD